MSPSDHQDPDNALGQKLEELESLLDKGEGDIKTAKIQLPVLDELVTEADFVDSEDENNVEKIEEQIVDLAEKLEHKFSGELDQLVRLLKDNLKNSIVEELRNQANIAEDETVRQETIDEKENNNKDSSS